MHWKSGGKAVICGQELVQAVPIEQGYYMEMYCKWFYDRNVLLINLL